MNLEKVIIEEKTYLIIDRIEVQDKVYIYLVNSEDNEDFCIRKLILENDKEYYVGLNDNQEFDLALMYFSKKHDNILKEEE